MVLSSLHSPGLSLDFIIQLFLKETDTLLKQRQPPVPGAPALAVRERCGMRGAGLCGVCGAGCGVSGCTVCVLWGAGCEVQGVGL